MVQRRTLAKRILAAALFCLISGERPAVAGVDRWTSGGPKGVSVNDIVIDPSSPRILYIGTDLGVFKSRDGGDSWAEASAGIEAAESGIGSLLIDPRDPSTLYAGGRRGGVVYKTTDGAATWRVVAVLGDGIATFVQTMAIDPTNSRIVYVAAPSASYKGIFKSMNGGASWFPINSGLPLVTIWGLTLGVATPRHLAFDPADPSILYASGLSLSGKTFVSTDAGATWHERTGLLPWPLSATWPTPASAFAVDPSAPDTLYNAVYAFTDWTEWEPTVVISKSTDRGKTWAAFGNGIRGQYGRLLVVDPSGRFLHLGTQASETSPPIGQPNGVFDFEITRPADPRHHVIPVVLDVAAGTARYTTELALTNDDAEPRAVNLVYTAALGSQEGSGAVNLELAPGEQKRIPDALGYLRSRGLAIPDPSAQWSQGGTLQVVTPEPAGAGRFSALARTASDTRAPLPPGRAGLAHGSLQTRPGYAALRVFGLRSTASDRSNLAVVNTSGEEMTFRVTVFSGSGDRRTAVVADGRSLPPYGWTQINSAELLDQPGIANGWALVERVSDSGGLNAYGVVNDRVTNDGSFLSPVAAASYEGLGIVPALVETSAFRSELVVANRSDVDAHLELRYVESMSPEGGAGGTVKLTLPARQQWVLPDAIDFLRRQGLEIGPAGPARAGALQVVLAPLADNPYQDTLYAGARTATRAAGGGEFGLFTPAVSVLAFERACVYGLVADESNRSNVAVVNAAFDPANAGPVSLRLQVRDGDAHGAARGNLLDVTLAPGQWKQFGDVLAAAGVTNGWVEITQQGTAGSWFAYGVINDGRLPGDRTGDGAYVPMAP